MQSSIEYGLCQCGCGQKAPISDRTHRRYGWIKGQPKKFIRFHNSKKKRMSGDGKGYIYDSSPEHPYADSAGRKASHLLFVEQILGRVLPREAVIHHVDGDKSGNRSDNLVVCQNHSYHAFLHTRMRALKECGHAGWRKCGYCHKWSDPQDVYITPDGKQAYHKPCKNKFQNEWKRERKQIE